ncbi:MAG TPA: hypothetical protein VHV31_02670 [Nitrolancea sp.]|nr:hypothetical protein [Nitrolancea sp.]
MGTGDNESLDQSAKLDFRVRLKVQILKEFKYADVATMLDALNDKWVIVESSRVSINPPAAGALETLLTIVISGEVANLIWHLFFSEIIEESGRTIQSKLRQLIHQGSKEPAQRAHPPLSFICGKVRLYIVHDLTEQQFSDAISAARELGKNLSAEKFAGDETVRSPDSFFSYFWDEDSGLWVPGRPRSKR